jgi:hypothetical protein
LGDEFRVRWVTTTFEEDVERLIPDMLRSHGDYVALAERARLKQDMLVQHGLSNAGLTDARITEAELLRWYFDDHLKSGQPENLPAYIRALGLEDMPSFLRIVLREYCYIRLTPVVESGGSH